MIKTIIALLLLTTTFAAQAQEKTTAEQLAQQQLDAYNNRDIEAFLKPYHDSVEVYGFPNRLQFKGIHLMRQSYADMFKTTPDLHCTLVNRMVQGNTVIDQESVIFKAGQPPLKAIAIYVIEGDKIKKVYFVQ
jgi:hypothetical protein